jgi:predicted Ser/Thr protein kinase
MNFKRALADAAKQGPAEQAEVITLNEYIDRVARWPTIAATAHQRIDDMVKAAGFSDGLHAGETSYEFFSAELFRPRRTARAGRALLRDRRSGA